MSIEVPIWLCIVILLFLFISIRLVASATYHGMPVCKFRNENTKKIYKCISNEFGNPTVIINQQGGFVMWFPKKEYTTPYSEILLKDEPGDCLYTTIRLNLNEQDLNTVLSVNKNLFYNRKTKELTIRSNSMCSSRKILYIIIQMLLSNYCGTDYLDKKILSMSVDDTHRKIDDIVSDSIRKIDLIHSGRQIENFAQKQYRTIPVSP